MLTTLLASTTLTEEDITIAKTALERTVVKIQEMLVDGIISPDFEIPSEKSFS